MHQHIKVINTDLQLVGDLVKINGTPFVMADSLVIDDAIIMAFILGTYIIHHPSFDSQPVKPFSKLLHKVSDVILQLWHDFPS